MLRLQLFGSSSLSGCPVDAAERVLAQPKRLAMLVYLVLATPRGLHRRDKLLPMLWPDLDEASARNGLSKAIHFLRQQLGEALLTNRGAQEIGVQIASMSCDVHDFERAVAAGRWEDADGLYRGHLLDGFLLPSAPAFDDWLDGERQRFRRRAADASLKLARIRRESGANGAAASLARRAIDLASMNEEAIREALRLFVSLGDRAGALRIYADFERQLASELGLRPAPETEALLASIREGGTA
jgi:serine/threonine-protein kinase